MESKCPFPWFARLSEQIVSTNATPLSKTVLLFLPGGLISDLLPTNSDIATHILTLHTVIYQFPSASHEFRHRDSHIDIAHGHLPIPFTFECYTFE